MKKFWTFNCAALKYIFERIYFFLVLNKKQQQQQQQMCILVLKVYIFLLFYIFKKINVHLG